MTIPHDILAIQQAVAAFYQIPVEAMTSKCRKQAWCWPRQVAMYWAYRATRHNLTFTGECFGGRNHTTVIHACDTYLERFNEKHDELERLAMVMVTL